MGPAKVAAEGWGVLVAVVSLFCTAILLIFVVAGSDLLALLLVRVFVAANRGKTGT
jgi:hypothetical protein